MKGVIMNKLILGAAAIMSRRSLISALPILLLLGGIEARSEAIPVSVATQNLYVGADLTPIFLAQTFPEALAAVTDAISDVLANNFTVRATAIATELKNSGAPLLVGLQEASNINITGTLGTVSLDYTSILLKALADQGLNYGVVGSNSYATSFNVPGVISATVTDKDVVLARTDVAGFSVTSSTPVDYAAAASATLITGETHTLTRGYVDVNATLNGTDFQFIDTHLESNSEAVRNAQAAELVSNISGDTIPTILAGDFNASPGTIPYNLVLGSGFIDVPAALGVTSPTCCQAEDLNNITSLLQNRFDYIFGRDLDSIISALLIGNVPFEDVRPRWASDHAGVVAAVTIEGEVVNSVVEPSSAGILGSAMFLSVLWYGTRRKS